MVGQSSECGRHFFDTFCSQFQKKGITTFQKHRPALIRSALRSSDARAFSAGPNFEIRPLGADFITFEVCQLLKQKLKKGHFVNCTFVFVVRYEFEVRWKVLSLARRMVSQVC